MTEQEILELQQRNALRLEEAKQKLGTKYLLHPANRITKETFRKMQKALSTNKHAGKADR